MNKPVGSGVFLAVIRLRQMPRIRIAIVRPSQRPATGAAASRGDWGFLPKQEKSEWVLRPATESWASSARSAHLPSDKLECKTYEKEQSKAVKS